MTDEHDDAHLDDEVLSALLDGEASAAEAGHAERCSECGTRLATLRAAADLVGAPVEIDSARRDEAVRRALDTALGDNEADNVVPMDRHRRVRPGMAIAGGLVAAAVAALVVIPLATSRSTDHTDLAAGSTTTLASAAASATGASRKAAPESDAMA